MADLEFTVNGEPRRVSISPKATLLEVIRGDLGLTGTKEGCGKGECGACTVLLEDRPVVSCLTPAIHARGRRVVTIEGLSRDGRMDPIQEAFVAEGAIQCGYCTPGMILSAKALLLKNDDPTEADIRVAIAGNLCRCTGYIKIIRAIQRAATVYRERRANAPGAPAADQGPVADQGPAADQAVADQGPVAGGEAS